MAAASANPDRTETVDASDGDSPGTGGGDPDGEPWLEGVAVTWEPPELVEALGELDAEELAETEAEAEAEADPDSEATEAVAVEVSLVAVVAVAVESIVKRGEKLSSETESPAEISIL